MINMKNICLSPSKKTFTFCKQSFFLSAENNCSIIYEGEWLLIHLVGPASKGEKVTQYDVNTHKTIPV